MELPSWLSLSSTRTAGSLAPVPWVEALAYTACACLGVFVYYIVDQLILMMKPQPGKKLPSPPAHALLGHIPAVAKYIARGEYSSPH